ncbi:MAG: putative glycoside hydrolase, partial [candidate division WOR-3 bacterium]|nr:putative glycoside hydrolase [candidate division WOR-3 bacterium]
ILCYRDLIAMHPYYEDWDICNLKEFAFLHSTDPAGVSVIPSKDSCIINWQKDGRDIVIGYNLYKSLHPDSNFVMVNKDIITSTSYVDKEFEPPQYYLIKSVTDSHEEIDFSIVRCVDSEQEPIALTNQNYKILDLGTLDDSISISISLSIEAFGSTKPNSAFAHLGLNRGWFNFIDYPFAMASIDNRKYTCTTKVTLPVSYKAGISYYFRFIKGNTVFRLPQDDSTFYTTNLNNRIRNPHYGWYAMDVLSPDWIIHYRSQCKRILSIGANGIFADDATRNIIGHLDCKPLKYTEKNWAEGMNNMISFIKDSIHPRILIFNGLRDDLIFLESADGGMIEQFAHTNSGYLSKKNWESQINTMLKSPPGKKVLVVSKGKEEDTSARIFSIASYLLGSSKDSYYCYAENYDRTEYYPEYEIDIGYPFNERSTLLALYDKKTGIYKRLFSNGIVLVNPDTSNSEPFEFDDTLYQVVIDETTCKYIPIANSLTLSSNSGVILLYEKKN